MRVDQPQDDPSKSFTHFGDEDISTDSGSDDPLETYRCLSKYDTPHRPLRAEIARLSTCLVGEKNVIRSGKLNGSKLEKLRPPV